MPLVLHGHQECQSEDGRGMGRGDQHGEHEATESRGGDMSERTCPSCQVDYTAHLGLIGTCKHLQTALAALRSLQLWAATDDYVPTHVEAIIKRTLDDINNNA